MALLTGFLLFLILGTILFLPRYPKIDPGLIIKSENIQTKQRTAIVVGQPVKWTTLINVNDINSEQYLVQLPKSAKNIKVRIITKEQAETLLSQTPLQVQRPFKTQLTDAKPSLSFPNPFYNLLKKAGSFLLVTINKAEAADEILADEIPDEEEIIPEQEISPEIIKTKEAVFIDLSDIETSADTDANSDNSEDGPNYLPEQPEQEQPIESESSSDEATDNKQEPELESEEPEEEDRNFYTSKYGSEEEEVETEERDKNQIPIIDETEEQALTQETAEETEEIIEDEYIAIDYETSGPIITEQDTDTGKLVTVSDPAEISARPDLTQLTDVLAYTSIPEIFKVGQEDKIKIKWQNNDGQEMPFTAYDLNSNGKIDYLEWTVPHLSEQVFEIIFISKAFKLDENREIIDDIYDIVRYQDNQWATIEQNNYVRVTFEQLLDNTKDITIYAKPAESGTPLSIEVYTENGTELLAAFPAIDHEDTYKILLTNLQEPTDVFDLKITGGDIDIDYIVDPPVTLYWVGSSGGNASVAANWATVSGACTGTGDASAAPGASDTAIFTSSCVNNANFNVTSVAAFTIQTGYTGTVSATSTLDVSGDMTITATATFQTAQAVDGSVTVTGTLLVDTGSTFVVRYKSLSVPDSGGAGQTITAGTLTINGNMNADGTGFAAGQGPGKSTANYDGGSYGGRGADYGANGTTGPTYGSITNPISLGSGGWSSGGGGAIIISSTGAVTVNGTLSANGVEAGDGRGSGGSINITAATLTGTGTIRANGASSSNYGSGGGGRVSLNGVTTDTFSGTLQANGGTTGIRDYAGTIYLNSARRTTLTLGGAGNLTSLRLGTDDTATAYTFGTITIQSGGTLEIDGNPSLNTNQGTSATLTVTTLDVQTGGTLSADSLGFPTGAGPGKSNTTYDGGSYGGRGGDYGANGTIGATYGSITNPISLGSGGWSSGGGGAIIISSTGAVTVNGTLSANGVEAGDGRGSGGSINITAATLTGTGTIRANGASSSNYGSGGGGRVSATQTTGTTWTPTFQAFGGSTGTKGAAGTIYLKDANDAAGNGELIIDNNNVATASGTDTNISSSVTGATVGSVTLTASKAGKLTIDSGQTLTVQGTGATLTVGTGATLTNNGTLSLSGTTFTNSGTFTSTASTSTVNYTGQTDDSAATMLATTYYDVAVNNAGTSFNLGAATTVNNNLTITAGTLNPNTYAVTGTGTNTLTITDIAKADAATFAGSYASFETITPGASSTINYSRAGDQTIDNTLSYKNLAISGSGTKTLGGTTTATGSLTHTAGTIGLSSYNLNIAGAWAGNGQEVTGSGAVVLNGSSQAVSGSTTFNNLTFTAPQTITFTAGTTQTLSGAFTCTGSAGNIITLASSTTSVFNLSKASGTVSCDYISVSYSAAAGGATWNPGSHSTDGGNNSGWVFDNTPPAPSSFSPASASTITDSTPTITFSLDENGDCFASTTDETYDAMSDNTNCTGDGTTSISCTLSDLGADGSKNVYIACKDTAYSNKDTADTNENLSYTLDTTAPTRSSGSPSGNLSASTTSTTISLTTDENATCKYSTSSGTAYGSMTDTFSTTGTTSHSQDISGLSAGNSYNYYVRCQDSYSNSNTDDYSISFSVLSAGGPGLPPSASNLPSGGGSSGQVFKITINQDKITTQSREVDLTFLTGDDTAKMAISNNSDLSEGTGQIPYSKEYAWDLCYRRIECPEGTYSVYVKFFTQYGVGSQIASAKIILREKPFIIEQIKQIPEKIKEFIPEIPLPFKPEPEEKPEIPEFPPIEETVKPDEVPLVFQGIWELIPEEPIRIYAFSPLPEEIRELAEKFPQLAETFKETGITKVTDIKKLRTAKLTLPGLTERAGLSLVKVKPGEFALPQGIPIAQLSLEAKQNLPSDIVFAKTAGELVDFNIKLTVTEKGEPEQKIATITGKPLQLAVKPDKPVKSVKGYLVFKRKKLAEPAPLQTYGLDLTSLLASAVFSTPKLAQVHNAEELNKQIETRLVLLEFEYTDEDNDGIYTAEIQAPVVDGEYEIITVMDYEDPELGSKEIRLITIVDPEGYVYEKDGDKETRIPGAIISLFWLNPETKQYELWPAKEFQQENPQTTDVRGTYSFLAPEGFYYLKVEAPGYLVYDGKPFQVKEGSGIHINIELKTKYWWLKMFDWRTILLIAVILLLLYNFYRDRMRSKTRR